MPHYMLCSRVGLSASPVGCLKSSPWPSVIQFVSRCTSGQALWCRVGIMRRAMPISNGAGWDTFAHKMHRDFILVAGRGESWCYIVVRRLERVGWWKGTKQTVVQCCSAAFYTICRKHAATANGQKMCTVLWEMFAFQHISSMKWTLRSWLPVASKPFPVYLVKLESSVLLDSLPKVGPMSWFDNSNAAASMAVPSHSDI